MVRKRKRMPETAEKKDRKEYFQNYYLDHKQDLSKKRHERYHTDPEYRERAKRAAREYRRRKKEERDRLRAEGKLPPARPKGPRKPTTVMVNGDKCTAYTVTITAQRLNRSVDTINYWTKAGLLPATPIRSKRGDRLYTDAMILVMQMAISRRGKIALRDKTFREEIERGWEDAGVVVG
jgi:hypothetical protein